MTAQRIRSTFLVADVDPLVREHRVHDIHILPGICMLDAIYKTLAAYKIEAEGVVLREIVFHEPVVTHANMDRKLSVSMELDDTGDGTITVSSLPWRGERAQSDDPTVHMQCRLEREAALKARPALCAGDLGGGDDLDVCYSVTRHVGIEHGPFMKCSGTVYRRQEGDIVARVALGKEAADCRDEFVLNPALLDCSTIVPLYFLSGRLEEMSLFIPFAIDAFCARSMQRVREILVRVEAPFKSPESNEILRHSIDLYDATGHILAAFTNFSVKRVRSLDNVQFLLESGSSARSAKVSTHPRPAVLSAPRAIASGTDPLVGYLGGLLARFGGITWKESDADTPFFDLGLDSLALLDASEALEKDLGAHVYPTLLFEHACATALAAYLRQNLRANVELLLARLSPAVDQPLAVCGDGATESTLTASYSGTAAVLSTQGSNANPPVEILVPRWYPVEPTRGRTRNARVALLLPRSPGLWDQLIKFLGQSLVASERDVQTLCASIRDIDGCDEIWLPDTDHERVCELARALGGAGLLATPLKLLAVTVGAFGVRGEAPAPEAGHGVWGLLQTVSREYPKVRCVQWDLDDLAVGELACSDRPRWLDAMLQSGAVPRQLVARRDGRDFGRKLLRRRAEPMQAASRIRPGGAYLIIGGTGGVGMTWLRHLRRHYGARVAVMGRRAYDEVRAQLAAEGCDGVEIVYLQGRVEEERDLRAVLEEARQRFGTLHGIVHSALVLEDRRLADMDNAALRRVTGPKVDGIRTLARVTEGIDLDFILIFSSVQSFIGNATQGNYAAASTFIDGYAAAMQASRRYPVVVINWGFWSEVGAVANDVYRHLLERQGMYGLRADDATTALETVLAEGWQQAIVLRARRDLLCEMGLETNETIECYGDGDGTQRATPIRLAARPLAPDERIALDETRAAMERLTDAARRRVAAVMREFNIDGSVAQPGRHPVARQHVALARALTRRIESCPGDSPLDAEAFNAQLDAIEDAYPVSRDFIPLLRAAIGAYPDILSGKCQAADVLFPGGSVDLVRAVYGRSALSSYYNRLVALAIMEIAGSYGRPLRILEIGAGTGSTTVVVLDALRAAGIECEYWHTDLWSKLIDEARDSLGEAYPELRFRFLDINADPLAQGVLDRFDVIVATNVLHAARSLSVALRHVKAMLRRGGSLVLNESVETHDYSTYTFGLLPGWWSATDRDARMPDSPLASRRSWNELLGDAGFVKVAMLTEQRDPALSSQEIFVAFSDGVQYHPEAAAPVFELPPALRGRLQPVVVGDPGVQTTLPKRLRLFRDTAQNLWIFLDNPPANMFTIELLGELCELLASLQAGSALTPKGGVVYLSHVGGYFSLGGDRSQIMAFIAAGDEVAVREFAEHARRLLTSLATLDLVVIAVIDGTAQGGGFETLLASDFQLLKEGVKVGLPEIKSGLLPGMGGLTHLSRRIGAAATKRLVFTGELIDAREAQRLGVVTHVVADPYGAALQLAQDLPHPRTIAKMKHILAPELVRELTTDLDGWVAYLIEHADLIDTDRIAATADILDAQAALAIHQESRS